MAAVTRWSLIKDIVGSLLFIILGGVFLREMGDLPKQVSKYPSILIYLIFALSLVLMVKAVASLAGRKYVVRMSAPAATEGAPAGENEEEKFGFPTAFVLVLSLLYVWSMPYIGFTVASAAMMLVFMIVMGIRSIPVLILVPLVEIAFLLYVFEKLLAVYLPGADWLRAVLGMG